ncbi:MAG: DUF4430 domain-containing protein [Clostridia bacterium]|nr:DUF4430 domain-containing protein [Clostridia bacterium]
MKKQTRKSLSSVCSALLCMVLVAAMALSLMACTNTQNPVSTPDGSTAAVDATPLGEGATAFTLEVADKEGKVTTFAIRTDKKTVGDALQELGLIEGEQSAYGLYIKKVNGITADYDIDQTYWAFYIDGKMAPSGVDSTDIVAGTTYALKVEK